MFTEVRFKGGNGKTVIPDGAIVCERGRKTWTCLVEVKTAMAELRDEQVGCRFTFIMKMAAALHQSSHHEERQIVRVVPVAVADATTWWP